MSYSRNKTLLIGQNSWNCQSVCKQCLSNNLRTLPMVEWLATGWLTDRLIIFSSWIRVLSAKYDNNTWKKSFAYRVLPDMLFISAHDWSIIYTTRVYFKEEKQSASNKVYHFLFHYFLHYCYINVVFSHQFFFPLMINTIQKNR